MKDEKSKFPEKTPLAMAYVPWQEPVKLYSINMAFEKATVFPDLYFPFTGRKVNENAEK